LNRKADHKENEDDRNGSDSPGVRPGESSQSNENTLGIPEATSSARFESLEDAFTGLVLNKGPKAAVANTDADRRGSSFRKVNGPSGSSTSQTIVLRPRRHLKRPLSPESSSSDIDLSSVRHLCLGSKMYELIDLTVDEVRFHSGILGFLCSRCVKIEQAGTKERTLLSFQTKANRVAGPPRLLYDAFGEAVSYTPKFHVSIKFN
jgi:hypothetical protein